MDWTLEKYRPANPGKKDRQIFDGNCKMAIKEFYKEIYAVGEETNKAMQAMVYTESLVFFRAFGAYGTTSANPEVPALTRRCLSIPNHF